MQTSHHGFASGRPTSLLPLISRLLICLQIFTPAFGLVNGAASALHLLAQLKVSFWENCLFRLGL